MYYSYATIVTMDQDISKLKVKELQALCLGKGFSVTGLKKNDLIDLLSAESSHAASSGKHSTAPLEGTIGGGTPLDADENVADAEIDSDDSSDGGGGTQDPILVENESLRLQIKLARLELEKLKLQSSSGSQVKKKSITVIDKDVKGLLPKMAENDYDVLNFFHAFERVLSLHDVEQNSWHLYLPATLNNKATKVYARLTIDQCRDYNVIKSNILTAFRLTARSYRQKFIMSSKYANETFALFLNRLSELFDHYLESTSVTEFNDLRDLCIRDRLLSGLSQNVR